MNRATAVVLWATVAVGGWAGAGCSSKAASPHKPVANVPAATAARDAATKLERRPVPRPAPRESATVGFTSPEYGVTFHYPRSYALEEESSQDDGTDQGATQEDPRVDLPGVRSAAELKSEQPGAILVASVLVPDDAYPNTNFAGGSVQFAVNTYETAQGCHEVPASRLGDSSGATGTARAGSLTFTWAEGDEGEGSTEFLERDYAGFSNGRCYEFFVRVGVAPSDDDDQLRPANQKKILGQLEKIVTSLQIQPQPVSVLDKRPAIPTNPRPEWSDLAKP